MRRGDAQGGEEDGEGRVDGGGVGGFDAWGVLAGEERAGVDGLSEWGREGRSARSELSTAR